VPIIVGVTGHRNIQSHDLDALKGSVRGILDGLKQSSPDSPLILLTSLAEGADRLVAEVAVELQIDIVVPLPMPLAEYKRDFLSTTSKREFSDLMSKSKGHFVVTQRPNAIGTTNYRSKEQRVASYARAGEFIAKHCMVLIALWDGVMSNSSSGTSQAVKIRLEAPSSPGIQFPSSLHTLEVGPVAHIITPRISNPKPQGTPFSVQMLFPRYWGKTERAAAVYENILDHLQTFNADLVGINKESPRSSAVLDSSSFANDAAGKPSEANRHYRDRYAVVDALANRYKTMRVRYLVVLYAAVILAFLYLQLYLEFWNYPTVLLMYPVILGLAALLHANAQRKRYHSKHEDYRALAEGLRVQIFWDHIDMNKSVSDHYLYKHTGELQWIRYALRAWGTTDRIREKTIGRPRRKPVSEGLKMAFDDWVLDQNEWYGRRSLETRTSLERLERSANVLSISGVGLSLLLYAVEVISPLSSYAGIGPWLHSGVMLAIAMALAISAAVHSYADKMSLSEESKQYQRMHDLFGLAASRLSSIPQRNRVKSARRFLFELGKEVLVENADWLLLKRSRPLELPKA